MGMGVLVGTSLVVVIPEGIETLYSASLTGVAKEPRSILSSDFHPMSQRQDALHVVRMREPRAPTPMLLGTRENEQKEGDIKSSSHEDRHFSGSPHAWTGVALLSGFVLMYLIDQVPNFMAFTKPTGQLTIFS